MRSKGSIVVSLVLALPLYLYVEPWGRNLEQKPPQSRCCPKGKSPTRTPGPNATILGVRPRRLGLGVWPRARRQDLRRLAPWPPQNPFCTDLKPHGLDPLAEPYHPIYESLRLDHFETPRHVPDLIRDSELLRYIKTCKLII